ncbi:MAG: D-glycero-beta-D-manno-heptose 1,7-bisphosphate 7-phosphatase [Gammaproteobacteria bacterium]|nr:D-glycero-beta-D-manno-heptose 1,7-bisphosphate 7-phosphatase [Gammaproteobacteria bacterium]
MNKFKLVILDRDGVINRDSDSFIKSPEEWTAIPGSLEAIARLGREKYIVVIITNQSGISQGLLSINMLNKIHQKMFSELSRFGGEISAIFFCPHSRKENCSCRKPAPGLFFKLAERLNVDLREVHAVGDSLRDLQAARAASARPILVRTGKGGRTYEQIRSGQHQDLASTPVYPDLESFVTELLHQPH